MKKEMIKLTIAQFAKLHNVNKRTLHYYDHISLFSPAYKGENGYRYYDYSQSIDFEFIRMLKEINLSIEEIKQFVHSFDEEDFLQTIVHKQKDIDEEIKKLKRVKAVLAQKQEQLLLCQQITDMEIQIREQKKEYLLTVPYTFEDDDFIKAFQHIQNTWSPEQYRAGVGSYISIDKVKTKQFDRYDGLYSPAMEKRRTGHMMLKPQGMYLCGYLKGTWDRLPNLYEEMLNYAGERQIDLSGYAFDRGINDFALVSKEDYITQVAIKIRCDDDILNTVMIKRYGKK